MNKEFIPYEQALELKELGFDEPCFGWFRTVDFKEYFLETELDLDEEFSDLINSNFTEGACSAPLYQQAFRWFREKHGYNGIVEGDKVMGYEWCVYNDNDCYIKNPNNSITYEQAEFACLKKLIKIIKNK